MLNKAPFWWTLESLQNHIIEGPKAQVKDRWVPARPIGFFSLGSRLKLAWKVFTGRMDALEWPGGQ